MANHTAGKLARLWMEAQPNVLSFICASIPRFHDAEDVLQEVAVEAAENFEKYDPQRPFIAWAIGIARFKVAAFYRRRPEVTSLLSEAALDKICELHVSRDGQMSDMREALELCVEQLAPKSRNLIQLRYHEGLASAQLAEKVNSTSGSVRVLLTRIRTQLQECVRLRLAKEGQR